ncbi:MAG TPA: ankyrin repeat domain-containing protein, partial [Planctomycetes bacterium]|nr:ankyrin repeat domain-containing protein [Planctomycetota bacterium]
MLSFSVILQQYSRRVAVLLITTFFTGCGVQDQESRLVQKKQPVVSEDIARFHQVVQNGSVLDLKAELDTDIDVNSPGRFEETALMVAIAANDLEKVKLLIQHGADPALTDKFN